MDKSKTLILIDGHALAFRQYYALERTNMRTSDGEPTWAVYGFFKAIFDLLKKQKPDAICVAFDVSHQTFRVDKYEQYKANRSAMPDDMSCQMQYIYDGLKAFNIPIYTKEGFEADDVIGTISKQACELGHKVLILTGDQDSFQLIDKDGCTKVIIPQKGELLEFDWQKVHDKLGVYPNQVIDYKSLRGDTSDNIPGVKGIGEKTAVKLLEEYGTLQNIIDNCDKIKPDGVKQKLCNDVEMAKLSYFLATIVKDVDINFDFDGTKVELPDVTSVTAFLRSVQFYTFLKNIDSILSLFFAPSEMPQNITQVSNDTPVVSEENGQMQLGLFAQDVKSKVNKINYDGEKKLILNKTDLINFISLANSKSLLAFKSDYSKTSAVEMSFDGLAIAVCEDVGFNEKLFCSESNSKYEVFYIPTSKHPDNELSEDDIIVALKEIFSNAKIKKITYDFKNEYNLWKTLGIELKGVIFDVLLASYVKDMSKNHTLSVQIAENLDYVVNDLVSTNTSIENLSLVSVLDYKSEIMMSIFELTKYWLNSLNDKELRLLNELEIPLAIVLADMEYTGVSVDSSYLQELSSDIDTMAGDLQKQIFEIAGEEFNVSSPKQVAAILFDKLKLSGKKKKTKYSTSAEVLEELAHDHEIARLILEYRKYTKLKSTYTDALPKLISDKDNRIHTTYNQTVTATGRLSSSNPNLQNIPIRSEYGNKIRKAFVPKDKNEAYILSSDYSQIELRLLAHISEDINLINAFKSGEDIHTITAAKVFDVPVNEVTKQMRYKAKAVNFGIVYGQSKYGLAKALGISVDDAQIFIDKYFSTYPKIKEYMQNQVVFAQKNGFVESLFGRKRYLAAELNSSNGMIREFAKRAAINYSMQGSASDLIKVAMVDLMSKMKNLKSKLIIQVHDELVVEVYKDELEVVRKLIKDSMELNQPLSVPLVIDINVGETWQES